MACSTDLFRIKGVLELLGRISPDARLLHLKNLCLNNDGIWMIPEDPARYTPALYEISLFGVPAISAEIEALPDKWQRAARNILARDHARIAA